MGGGGTDTEIRVSTESRSWRRKFSRRSCRDSNPQPFNYESGALTTELSPPLVEVCVGENTRPRLPVRTPLRSELMVTQHTHCAHVNTKSNWRNNSTNNSADSCTKFTLQDSSRLALSSNVTYTNQKSVITHLGSINTRDHYSRAKQLRTLAQTNFLSVLSHV